MSECCFCNKPFISTRITQKTCASKSCKYLLRREWGVKNKSKVLQSQQNYRKNNLGKMASNEAKHRARRYFATPKWLDEFEELWLVELYDLANKRGLEVDHIIPLQGKVVCGLHVPWNLQLLSKTENCKKSNRFGENQI